MDPEAGATSVAIPANAESSTSGIAADPVAVPASAAAPSLAAEVPVAVAGAAPVAVSALSL